MGAGHEPGLRAQKRMAVAGPARRRPRRRRRRGKERENLVRLERVSETGCKGGDRVV